MINRHSIIALFLVLSALVCIFCITHGHAASQETHTTTIDDVSVDKSFLLKIFRESVFIDSTYYDDWLDPSLTKITEQEYPWLVPHLLPQTGFPKPLSINKWASPIKISFGYPNDLKPFNPKLIDGKIATEYTDWPKHGSEWIGPHYYFLAKPTRKEISSYGNFSLAEEDVVSFASAASQLTGLNVSYLPNSQETYENYGNIRIILLPHPPLNSLDQVPDGYFKRSDFPSAKTLTAKFGVGGPQELEFFHFENRLNTAFRYRNWKRHVEGYFISNEKNEIEFAVCYIWERHSPQVFKGLLRECLLRSLGFPDYVTLTKKQTLEHITLLRSWNAITPYGDKLSSYLNDTFSFTDLDRAMILMLYNKDLKSGDSFKTINETLIH